MVPKYARRPLMEIRLTTNQALHTLHWRHRCADTCASYVQSTGIKLTGWVEWRGIQLLQHDYLWFRIHPPPNNPPRHPQLGHPDHLARTQWLPRGSIQQLTSHHDGSSPRMVYHWPVLTENSVRRERDLYRCGVRLDLCSQRPNMGTTRGVLVHFLSVRRILPQLGHDLRGTPISSTMVALL